ncbi:MAG: glycosyltransferase family 2 protein [Gammaproteobacteria bacterium]
MKISVILSTYNQPDWLEKSVWGYMAQTDRNFEIIVADDGSGPETTSRIGMLAAESDIRIRHVWQEDDGFQKTRILNKAILASGGDYLLFSDGDCIPRSDFVAVHRQHAQPGRFLSGGYFKLPMAVSQAISRQDIEAGDPFSSDWLKARGVRKPQHKWWKLTASGKKTRFLNRCTPAKASWNGHNASGWRSDIVTANGFDERMRYGGEDRELGERLVNAGIRPIQLRYSTVCLHLDHARGYVDAASRRLNDDIRRETRSSGVTRTGFGLDGHSDAPSSDNSDKDYHRGR